MIGKVTGTFIQKNRNGTANVRMLQVEITDSTDVQEVEYYGASGEDSPPVNGSLVEIFDNGDNWKIAIGCNDNIEPSALQGEKLTYAINSTGEAKAKHKQGTDDVHTFNDGSNNAARQNDQTKVTVTEDSVMIGWISIVSGFINGLAPGTITTVPTTITGKITQGTDKVKLP